MCCLRAGHVAEGVAARRHMMRPEERVLLSLDYTSSSRSL